MSLSQENLPTIPTKIFKNCQWLQKSQPLNKRKSPNYPCRRWGHTAVLNEKYMYVFSGCGKSDNIRQWEQIYRMDCLTFQWERINSPSTIHPQGRDSHSCVCLGNTLYFFAGSCNDTIMNDLWSFDLETYEWKELTVHPDLQPREGHSMATISDRIIYISGGWNSGQNIMTDSHWLYDTVTKRFMQITTFTGDEMNKLESHSTNLIGESIYVFGGQGQLNSKSGTFYRDLYKLDFDVMASIHEKFDQWHEQQQEIENKDSELQIQPQELSIKIEKIKPNNSLSPSPRASHTAVVYADRFLFIVGGEGYQYDQVKDNNDEEVVELEGDQQGLEEEEKPIFPKNDIWIFETVMRTWSKLMPKSKSPIFQPRFSHSCVVFKDQLIIFGGLRSMGEVLEDIMVLHLKDSDNHLQKFQRDEMKNVCRYCQLIYGIQIEEDIIFQKMVESQFTKNQKVSISFIHGITHLIQWPFACFGLFLDNAKLSQCNEFRIDLVQYNRRKIYQSSVEELLEKVPVLVLMENDGLSFNQNEFLELLFNFEIPTKRVCITKSDQEQLSKNGVAAMELLNLDQQRVNKKQYGINLKMGGLRLGESMLICNKIGNSYNVGLISMNRLINPNVESATIYHYQLTIDGKDKKVDSSENRYILLNGISHLFTEDDIILQEKGNYTKVFIFDLVKLFESKNSYEIIAQNDDFINQQYFAYEITVSEAIKYPDYSLLQYLQIYQFGKLPFKLYLQNQQVIINSSPVNRIDAKYTIEMKNDTIIKRLYDCTESYIITSMPTNNFGIYIYSQNRLINRFKYNLGERTKELRFSGYVNVRDFLQPSLTCEGFQNSYLSAILNRLIDQMIDPNEIIEPEIRKEVKM